MSHPLEWCGPCEQFHVVILGTDGDGNLVEYGGRPKRERAFRRGPSAPPRAGGRSRCRDFGVRVRGKAHRCERATRFMPGTMVVSRPVVPEPLPVRFPFPPLATNPDEAATDEQAAGRRRGEIVRSVGAPAGPKLEL